MESNQGKVGRPSVETPPGRRVTLSFRTSSSNKGRLLAAASGERNLSEEMERRVDVTFQAEDMLDQASRLFWPANSEFVFLVGELANNFAPKGEEWRSNDEAIRHIFVLSIARALACLFDPERALRRFDDVPDKIHGIEDRTDFFLHAMGADTPWARAKRERLGELGERLIAWHEAVEAHPYIEAKRSGEADPPPSNAKADAFWARAFDRSAGRHAEEARREEDEN